MKSSVIENEKLNNHFIQNYRFKVLSSTDTKEQKNLPIEDKQKNEEIQLETKEEDIPKFDTKFIEELLKKSDELSSNMIKLQMQIENQEEQFNQRLEQELIKAKEQAYNQGYETANKENQDKILLLEEKFANSIDKLDKKSIQLQEYIDLAKNDLKNGAIKIAKELILKEIDENGKELSLRLVKHYFSEFDKATDIKILVNPSDAKYLLENLKDSKIEIVEDVAIDSGGVVIMSDKINIDATKEARLEKLGAL